VIWVGFPVAALLIVTVRSCRLDGACAATCSARFAYRAVEANWTWVLSASCGPRFTPLASVSGTRSSASRLVAVVLAGRIVREQFDRPAIAGGHRVGEGGEIAIQSELPIGVDLFHLGAGGTGYVSASFGVIVENEDKIFCWTNSP